MREEAVDNGALQVFANTEVLDIETESSTASHGHAPSSPTRAASRPSTSPSPAACGARASRRWRAPTIPLTPAVHQMADVGPIDVLAGDQRRRSPTRSSATWTRSATSARRAGSMEVGSYAHRPIFHHPDDIPSNEESALSPTELPFTADDFDHADGAGDRPDGDARRRRDQVRHQRPAVAHARRDARARRDRRGAQPVVGRRGVDQGRPRHRPARRRVDDLRLPAHVRPALVGHQPLLRPRDAPSTTSTPAAPSTSTRPTASSTRASSGPASAACAAARSTPARRRSARCSSTPAAGSGRSGTSRTPTCSTATPGRCEPRPHEWDARWWSPITNAEHLHMREHVGMVDLTRVQRVRLRGPGRRRLPAATCA